MDNEDPIKNVVFYTKGDGDAVEVTKMNENEVRIIRNVL